MRHCPDVVQISGTNFLQQGTQTLNDKQLLFSIQRMLQVPCEGLSFKSRLAITFWAPQVVKSLSVEHMQYATFQEEKISSGLISCIKNDQFHSKIDWFN
jgi:hypothetical protein